MQKHDDALDTDAEIAALRARLEMLERTRNMEPGMRAMDAHEKTILRRESRNGGRKLTIRQSVHVPEPEPSEAFVDAFRTVCSTDGQARELAETFHKPEMVRALCWLWPPLKETIDARMEKGRGR